MTYTDTIVRQLLVTLKKDFRTFENDLKGVWDQKVDQDLGKLEKAEKDLASREAEEKSAQEAAEKAAKEAEVAKAKAEARVQSAEAAKSLAGASPRNRQLQKRADIAEKEAKDAGSVSDEYQKSAEDARQKAAEAAKQADDARKARQEARTLVGSSQPYSVGRDWLAFKSGAAVRSINLAIRSPQSVAIVKSDLNLLHKEMRARSLSFFAHVGTFAHCNKDGVKKAEATFESISQKLYLFNSVSDGDLPQQRFFQIYFAAERAVTRFEQVNGVLTEWKQHWDPYFQGLPNLDKAGTLIASLRTRSETARGVALAAALSCEIEFHRESYSTLCEELTELYEEYSEAVCLLDHLQTSPDLEPTFLPRIHRQLNRAGYFIEHALSALKVISLAEKDRPTRLAEAWKLLVAETKAIAQNHSALYAKPQPCAQPDPCQPQILQIGASAQEGLSHALTYKQDPACHFARKGQSEAISKMEATLDGLRDGGLRPRVFDKLWWAMVQINLLLSGCPDEEEKCLVTDKQLDVYVERLKAYLIGAGCNTLHLRPTCDRQTMGSLLAMVQTEPHGSEATASDHTARAARCAERLNNSALLAARLRPLVPEGMRPQLEEIIKQAESLRQAEQASGGSPSASLVKQLSRRSDAANATLKATFAVALDIASGAEKEQLKALDQQLLCEAPGRQSADYQIGDLAGSSAFDPAAKAKGGAAL
jgi:hypothetical protein